MICFLLSLLLSISNAHSKLVFTGVSMVDDIILTSNLTVLIKAQDQQSLMITNALGRQNIDYNVAHSSIIV